MKDEILRDSVFFKKLRNLGVRWMAQQKRLMINAGSGELEESESIPCAKCGFTSKQNVISQTKNDIATLFYSLDGKKWTLIGTLVEMM
jgi:hypothetical protein